MITPKPSVSLSSLSNTLIHTPTEADYTTLMRIYECGRWRWKDEISPLERGWGESLFGNQTAIKAENWFSYCDCSEQSEKKSRVILPEDFYEIQKVTLKDVLQINRWFDTRDTQ